MSSLRYKRPHLRCGICDLEFEDGDETVYVDDERCHVWCADDVEPEWGQPVFEEGDLYE